MLSAMPTQKNYLAALLKLSPEHLTQIFTIQVACMGCTIDGHLEHHAGCFLHICSIVLHTGGSIEFKAANSATRPRSRPESISDVSRSRHSSILNRKVSIEGRMQQNLLKKSGHYAVCIIT